MYQEPTLPVKPNAPCKCCKSRTADCHGKCRAYMQFVAANKKYVKAKNKLFNRIQEQDTVCILAQRRCRRS